MHEIQENILTKVITKRPSDSFKSNYGKVLLIGGNENYGGAIIMSAEAAINSGAGLTAVATHSINLASLHARAPEVMFVDWQDKNLGILIEQVDVIICGPGLGTNRIAKRIMELVQSHISSSQSIVLDASALDLIANENNLFPDRAGHIVLMPHQMEWQRLSEIRIPYQTDKANLTGLKQLFPNSNVSLVLKSNHTHLYSEEGQTFINPIGNPGMAIGGMGDTLAGVIGAFIAQFGIGSDVLQAAIYLHSLAGDQIFQTQYIVRPTKLSSLIPQLMKKYSK